ncbi:MAG: GtrA family protein [Erythrobacter sp.]|jgi:putative flippase GtrA
MMATMFARLQEARFLRYIVASGGALAVDMGSFIALLQTGLDPAIASAIGYSLGIAAHWLMSSRAVFAGHVAERGIARTRQKALFVGSALAGLALTTAIVGAGDALGFDPRLAKLVAVGASFIVTWLMRSHIVFRQGRAQ